jgi:hypothetical protein
MLQTAQLRGQQVFDKHKLYLDVKCQNILTATLFLLREAKEL